MPIWRRWSQRVIGLVFVGNVLSSSAQTQLTMVNEVKLPVGPSRGSFRAWVLASTSTEELFAIRIAPDESLLTFSADSHGEWPLVRTRRWWAQSSSSEVLHIPAWSTVDAKFIGEIHMDLQVSPTGRYAVAFAGANWSQKGDGVPFAPKVARKPDTIITVIDLEQWTIVKSIHTKSFEETDFRGGRIMNGNWIALQGLGIRTSPGYSVYLRHNRLLSIPDLTPGPECTSRRGSSGRENDSTCREILKSTSTASVKALEARVYMGQDPEPTALLLRSLVPGQRDIEDRLQTQSDARRTSTSITGSGFPQGSTSRMHPSNPRPIFGTACMTLMT